MLGLEKPLMYLVNTNAVSQITSSFKSRNCTPIVLFIWDWKVEGAIVECLYLTVGLSFKKQNTNLLFDLHSQVVLVLARVKVIRWRY